MDNYITETGERLDGVYKIYEFPNGYGASVIKNQYSYGGPDGLWELAVLDKEGSLTYDTPITNDVIGYLTEPEVTELLKQISRLPWPFWYRIWRGFVKWFKDED